jgi:hypothetical protein
VQSKSIQELTALKQKIASGVFHFDEMALRIFRFQYEYNSLYQKYCNLIKVNQGQVNRVVDIPFLPIEFFKYHQISSRADQEELIFTSSATTGSVVSRHYIYDLLLYQKHCVKLFETSFGKLDNKCFLFLLPSYLERKGSSLVAMANYFVEKTQQNGSGFYLNQFAMLKDEIWKQELAGKEVFLFGVSFALLDFADYLEDKLPSRLVVIDTGGMKGRKKEITKDQLHKRLKMQFGVTSIFSEYGMTELLSQAYANSEGWFTQSNYLRVFCRTPKDPFEVREEGRGALNLIDLANIDSISFIASADQGVVTKESFEVLGRLDHTDIRGCNLMML